MKKLYLLLIALLSVSAISAQTSIVHNFNDLEIGTEIGVIGWGAGEIRAVVESDPIDPVNQAIQVTLTNWGAVPVLSFELPAGVNLTQYTHFTFRGIFNTGDMGWKAINVRSFGNTQPTIGGTPMDPPFMGTYDRSRAASPDWETIEIPILPTIEETGTVWIAFGMHTGGGTWYADDVTLVGPGVPNLVPVNQLDNVNAFGSKNTIVVNNVEGKKIDVYSITGTKVYETVSGSSSATVTVPSGIYIVVVNGIAKKVVVQ